MRRFLNNPDDVVDETVAGYIKAHSDIVHLCPDNARVVVSNDAPREGKVGIVSGGGSGHEPAFIGYVGSGMLDAAAIGEIFASPSAAIFKDAIKAAESGCGVAVLYGNYAGDNMNVKMARTQAERDGIEVATVVANDDVASADFSERYKRRGVAGEIFMWKVGAAMAAQGGTLQEVVAVAQTAIDNCRSVGVGLGPCTLPAVGHPNFEIRSGEMEMGIGHHGEPGTSVEKLGLASDIASVLTRTVLQDPGQPENAELAVLLSGLGATPSNELYILYDQIEKDLGAAGHSVHKAYVGNYFTSLEMFGASLTIMSLNDQLKELLAFPAHCPAFGVSS